MPSQSKLPVGQTYRAIDNWCLNPALNCLLLRVHPPYTLIENDDTYTLIENDDIRRNMWNFEVWDGESTKFLSSAHYTLIPLEQSEDSQ